MAFNFSITVQMGYDWSCKLRGGTRFGIYWESCVSDYWYGDGQEDYGMTCCYTLGCDYKEMDNWIQVLGCKCIPTNDE